MASNIDPAIIEALGLDSNKTKLTSHGGSGFASTFKLSSTVKGKEINYFVKTGTGSDAALMFQGEILYKLRPTLPVPYHYVSGYLSIS